MQILTSHFQLHAFLASFLRYNCISVDILWCSDACVTADRYAYYFIAKDGIDILNKIISTECCLCDASCKINTEKWKPHMHYLKFQLNGHNTDSGSVSCFTADPQHNSRSLDKTSALALQLCFPLRYQQTRCHSQPVVAMERLCR